MNLPVSTTSVKKQLLKKHLLKIQPDYCKVANNNKSQLVAPHQIDKVVYKLIASLQTSLEQPTQYILHSGLWRKCSAYRISANSFRGNYSFLNLTLCTVTFGVSTYRCGNYSREETIQRRKLFAEIQYFQSTQCS